MSSILVDNNGSPFINDTGDILIVSGKSAIIQRIYNIFNTPVGSELFNLEYGLDINTIISFPNISIPTIRSIVADALNPSKIQGIKELNSLEVSRDGNTLNITISVTTDTNEVIGESIFLEV